MTRHEYIHEGTFEFEAGGSIEGLRVVYHCSDRLWQEGDERKVIWICHALTANSDAQDWWPEPQSGKRGHSPILLTWAVQVLGHPYLVTTEHSYSLSLQFSSVAQLCLDSLWPHGLQHARPRCPSPTPGVYSNSCPLSW